MKFRTALADDDFSRCDELTTKNFYAKPLAITVATVSGAAACFFMCHFLVSLLLKLFDEQSCVGLTMTHGALVAFAALVLDRTELFALFVLQD